jgi:hypothetical protein
MSAFLLFLAHAALAESADEDWLKSAEAESFRERVVTLALIYGNSSGIDPRGYMVIAHEVSEPKQECADVEVDTYLGPQLVAKETEHACRH